MTSEELGYAIIVICSCIQLSVWFSTRRKLKIFKDIFPETKKVNVDIEEGTGRVKGVKSSYKNVVFTTILNSLNQYLFNNQGSVTDFNLMKDIIERNSDAVEEEIDSQISLPINIGLMGTMLGIIFGVISLIESGVLDNLVSASGTTNISGIIALLQGVGIAMVTSILGIIVSTILTISFKKAKKEVEREKNDFITWIQSNLLPKLSSDFASVINDMTTRLSGFNDSFSGNAFKLDNILNKLDSLSEGHTNFLHEVNNLNIKKIAKANIDVYEKLKDCTAEIGILGEYLSSSREYVQAVTELNDKLDKREERVKAVIQVAEFFKQEREQLARAGRQIANTQDALDQIVEGFKDNAKKQVDSLIVHMGKLREHYERNIEEEGEALQKRMSELSAITAELKNMSAVKAIMSDLEKTTREQNAKIDALTKSIKELAMTKATGGTSSPVSFWSLMPKWAKISFGVFVGLITITCIAYIVFNVLSLVVIK